MENQVVIEVASVDEVASVQSDYGSGTWSGAGVGGPGKQAYLARGATLHVQLLRQRTLLLLLSVMQQANDGVLRKGDSKAAWGERTAGQATRFYGTLDVPNPEPGLPIGGVLPAEPPKTSRGKPRHGRLTGCWGHSRSSTLNPTPTPQPSLPVAPPNPTGLSLGILLVSDGFTFRTLRPHHLAWPLPCHPDILTLTLTRRALVAGKGLSPPLPLSNSSTVTLPSP
jgi:hypothetical protein